MWNLTLSVEQKRSVDYTWCMFARFSSRYLPKAPVCHVFTNGWIISLYYFLFLMIFFMPHKALICQVLIKVTIYLFIFIFDFFVWWGMEEGFMCLIFLFMVPLKHVLQWTMADRGMLDDIGRIMDGEMRWMWRWN